MRAGRPHAGEITALVGALALLVVLFLPWFSLDVPGVELERSGWSGLGWLPATAVALLVALGVAVAVTVTLRLAPAWSVGVDVLAVAIGAVATLALLVAVLAEPGLGVGAPNAAVDVSVIAWLGVACAALVPVGAWIAVGDDRTGAPESAYTPPPARPVPGASSPPASS